MNARDRFIEENIGLVHSCASRFRGRGLEYDDLYQAGCLGLVKAYDAFDWDRGVRFSTYAVPVILGEIRRLFRDGGTVKIGRLLKERCLKVSCEREKFCEENGREPSIGELAERMNLEISDIAEALSASVPPLSLTQDGEDENSELDIGVESHENKLTEKLALRQTVLELAERDRKIIELRYFAGKTQTETAKELGMTQVQVSRREKLILGNMRLKLTG